MKDRNSNYSGMRGPRRIAAPCGSRQFALAAGEPVASRDPVVESLQRLLHLFKPDPQQLALPYQNFLPGAHGIVASLEQARILYQHFDGKACLPHAFDELEPAAVLFLIIPDSAFSPVHRG